jgi:hypothetical protein
MKRSRETLEESVGETCLPAKRIQRDESSTSTDISSSTIYISNRSDKESKVQHTGDESIKKTQDDTSIHCSRNRPRTERYIENLQKYQKVQETIRFFQESLKSLGEKSSSQQLIQHNLSEQLSIQQTKYQSSLLQCVDDAQERLDIYNSLQCVRTAATNKNTSCCSLVMLHQGIETTNALFDRIAQFAGIPSNDEIIDCEQLITIACSSFSDDDDDDDITTGSRK